MRAKPVQRKPTSSPKHFQWRKTSMGGLMPKIYQPIRDPNVICYRLNRSSVHPLLFIVNHTIHKPHNCHGHCKTDSQRALLGVLSIRGCGRYKASSNLYGQRDLTTAPTLPHLYPFNTFHLWLWGLEIVKILIGCQPFFTTHPRNNTKHCCTSLNEIQAFIN